MRTRLQIAIVLACLFSVAASHANVLVNGDFETGDLTGWNLGPGILNVGAPGVGAQGGTFALEMTAPTDGVPEVNQGSFDFVANIAANPGDVVNLSGYMLTEAPLPAVGVGATFCLFKIVFEDAV